MSSEPVARSFKVALRELSSAQKPGDGVPAYTRWVNRGAGRVLAAVAYSWGISPDTVTVLSGLLSFVAFLALALAPISVAVALAVVFLLLLAYALDSADGQVARLSGTSSRAGEWLDHVVDAARLPSFHLAVAAALLKTQDAWWPVVMALLFSALVSTWFFAQNLAVQLVPAGSGSAGQERRRPSNAVSFAKLPADIGTLYILVALIPIPPIFVVCYGALFVFSVLQASLSMFRRYAELKQT